MKRKELIAGIIMIICIANLISLRLSDSGLKVSHYTLEWAEADDPVRIVQLTDLHNSTFGKDNARLVSKTKKQSPDVIFVTGDMLNEDEENIDTLALLLHQLAEIAPVYVSYGNHEKGYIEQYNADLKKILEETGITVLDDTYIDLELKGTPIRLGGVYGYCLPEQHSYGNESRERERAFMLDFQDTDAYKILLCHIPVCWIENDSLNAWDVDCIFSGHAHGGQVRFPLIGGLWAPDQGWFPGKEAGLYTSDDGKSTLVLSKGLGTTEKLPRFNNIPEIVVVDLMPAD